MAHWRSLRWAAWLGWQIESNWANPWLFALYVLVKPLAGSFLLVCMYWAAREAAPGNVASGFLPFLYVSSACFLVLGAVALGMTGAVVSDRDSYGMLKFIRLSPAALPTYLVGRGLSRAGQALLGVIVSVGLGTLLFPELRTAFGGAGSAWGWLMVDVPLGAAMLTAVGLILAGAVLNMARYGMFLGEGVTGALYLLSGAAFPIAVLPGWLRPVSLALPPTYWLEAMRRSLLGHGDQASPLGQWSHAELALGLAVGTGLLLSFARWFFAWSERRAWRHGRYDEVANT